MAIKDLIAPGNIKDKYTIEHVLGKGGFSVVRLGCTKDTRQKVALKFILKGMYCIYAGLVAWKCSYNAHMTGFHSY